MNLPHDKFCVLPWVSIEASPIGTVRPCCLADDEIRDAAGQKYQLTQATFDEIRQSPHMRKLREQFLAGQQPQTCRKCWQEERAGRTSKRMHTLNRLKHQIQDRTWTESAEPLLFVDLKLGNICNLKCRICGSWSSSQFAAEDIAWIRDPQEKKASYGYQMLRAGAWPQENPEFWADIDRHLDHIRYIEFTGGEPFLIPEHFSMLQGIRDRGIANQVEIHYNTNGTVFPEQAPEIWRDFRTVEIAVSIDDVGARFEYQRTNARWAEVEQNLQRFRTLRQALPGIQLQCCSTVNIFNIATIDAVANFVATQAFDFVYWNVMHDAWYFSVGSLPDSVKTWVTERLARAEIPPQYWSDIQGVIEFMNRGASTDGAMTRMKIADLDRKRHTDFAQVSPEMARQLGYEFPG